ncbi:hypothetical protein SLE2022_182130 [Rubroshorea leprosula]
MVDGGDSPSGVMFASNLWFQLETMALTTVARLMIEVGACKMHFGFQAQVMGVEMVEQWSESGGPGTVEEHVQILNI